MTTLESSRSSNFLLVQLPLASRESVMHAKRPSFAPPTVVLSLTRSSEEPLQVTKDCNSSGLLHSASTNCLHSISSEALKILSSKVFVPLPACHPTMFGTSAASVTPYPQPDTVPNFLGIPPSFPALIL
jgi:hypothetical protein